MFAALYPDTLHLLIGLGPLAVYLLLFGIINIVPRPMVLNGARDRASLALGISGLVVAGPMELFLPGRAALALGYWAWVLLIVLYALLVFFWILTSRPRVIIYHSTVAEIGPALLAAARKIDSEAAWSGNTLWIPKGGVQLALEDSPYLCNVQLVATGHDQSRLGWRQLERELAVELRQTRSSVSPCGVSLLLAASTLFTILAIQVTRHGEGLADAFQEMLRM